MSAFESLPGVIFVMIGPGGAGKNAIMRALIARFDKVEQLATATTRPMRGDEAQGREHHFLSRAEFTQMLERGDLLEHQEVTPGKFYGIPRRTVAEALVNGCARIADIDVLGAIALAQAFRKNVVQIFVTAPGETLAQQLSVLRQRMQVRADLFTDIEARLERAMTLELPYQDKCDYVIVNDSLAQAIERTSAIVQSELQARSLLGEPS